MVIAAALLEDLIAHAREEYDAECCGMVAYAPDGDGDDLHAVRVHRAVNIFASRKRFEIDGKELLRTLNEFEAEGWELHTYAFDPHFLHLDVQLGMLAEGLAVVCVEAVEPKLVDWLHSKRIRVIPVPYSDAMQLGTNVVALGEDRVLVPASSQHLIAACRAEGLTVYDPDVSMIANGGGAVHCMCQALTRDSAA